MKSPSNRSWAKKAAVVLTLIVFTGGELAVLAFGSPPEPELTREEHVRAILADYSARKGELLDFGTTPTGEILIKILRGSSGDTSSAVLMPIRALGFLGRPQGYEDVVPYLSHTDLEVRLAAIRSLGQMGKFDAIPLLEPFLRSTVREERREAIIALGKFGKPELIPQIHQAAAGDAEFERLAREAEQRTVATAKALRIMRFDDVVDAVIDTPEFEDLAALIIVTKFRLLEILSDKTRSPATRERCIRVLALARIRKAGMPMREILADPGNPFTLRLRAVYGLGWTGTKSATPQLIALLDDPEPLLREFCILSLGQIGDLRALEPLLARWNSSGAEVRVQLRLAVFRLRSIDGVQSLLEPLRTYQPRAISDVYSISDALDLSRGYDKATIEPFLNSFVAEERRDALLLLATLGTAAESPLLETYSETDADPLNREIANLGVERLKDIPIWERP